MLKTILFISKKVIVIIIMLFAISMIFFISPGNIYSVPTSDLIVSYDFNGNLLDSLNGSTLTPFDTSNDGFNHNNNTSGFRTDSGIGGDTTYWYWTSTLSRGGGFVIDVNSELSSDYSVGVRFAFNQTEPSYKKIIDYKNMASDNGFYFLNSKLNFYPLGTATTTTVGNNQIVDIIATRDSETGNFTAYFVINSILTKELEVSDSSNYAYPSIVNGKTRFGFFFDDIATSSEATDGGKVYSIKIWNGPITQLQAETAMDATQAPVDMASQPLTPEEIVSLNLSIIQQVDLYGASNIGFTKTLYDNILGRTADSEGLDYWVSTLTDDTMIPKDVVYHFVFSEELKPKISLISTEEFITFLYKNVLNREPDSQGYDGWVRAMENGMSKEDVLLHFTDTDEFKNIYKMFGLDGLNF